MSEQQPPPEAPPSPLDALLDEAAESVVARAARAFRAAGFTVQLGTVFDAPGGPAGMIELIARTRHRSRSWTIEASWHVAFAPGRDGLLVVLEEAGAAGRTVGFRPLANARFDALLSRMDGRYTSIGLFDAPRIRANALLEAVTGAGVNGPDHRALGRSLASAGHALRPSVEPFVPPRPEFRFACPLLITDAVLYEATADRSAAHPAETCYVTIEPTLDGTRSVEIVGGGFIETYARMAGEAITQLPRVIRDSPAVVNEPSARGATQVDAWERFRSL